MGVLFIVALAGITTLMVWQSYRSAVAASEAKAVSSAHVVAANVEWMIEASDQALRRIDTVFESKPIQSSIDTIADIAQAVGNLPSGFQYSIYDETGRLRLSSVPGAAIINVSDRPYFQAAKQAEDTVISPQLQERLSKDNVFVIARRISRAGSFHGVATIAIPAHTLRELWNSMGLGEYSAVSVIRNDGWLVSRYPVVPSSINLSHTPIFTEPLKLQQSGIYHSEVSPIDGKTRVVGFWRLKKWPLVAVTGVARGEMLDLFWASFRSEARFGLPMIVLLLLEGLLIAALLRAFVGRNRDLERALERNNFLFREIHHRVKNNLQAVSALVRLQPIPEQARKEMVHRISAMIAVHEQIYQSDQFDRVEAAPYLARVISEIAKAYNRDVDIVSNLDSLLVDRDQALPIGLVVNEVVSNAFKYAFGDGRKGKLEVNLVREADQARLTIKDDGPGFEPGSATKGMGSKLIAGFVAQLGGKYTLDGESGTVFTMTIPVH